MLLASIVLQYALPGALLELIMAVVELFGQQLQLGGISLQVHICPLLIGLPCKHCKEQSDVRLTKCDLA